MATEAELLAELADGMPDDIDLFRAIRNAKAQSYADAAKAAYSIIAPYEAALRARAATMGGGDD